MTDNPAPLPPNMQAIVADRQRHAHTRLLALGIPAALFAGESDALNAMVQELAGDPATAELGLTQLAAGVLMMAIEAARSRGSDPSEVFGDGRRIWLDFQRSSVAHVGRQLAGEPDFPDEGRS